MPSLRHASVAETWNVSGYPALSAQTAAWRLTRPSSCVRVLDSTPVYTNTKAKCVALQAGGVGVTVSAHRGVPRDPQVLAQLPGLSVTVADELILARGFDVVLDCAGTHTDVPSRLGNVELTRSSFVHNLHCSQPVLVVDSGVLKRNETTLGTGNVHVRAMAHLGHPLGTGASTSS